MAGHIILATLALSLAPNAAITGELAEPAQVDVAYEQLRDGDVDSAVRHLEESRDVARDDPARLINLGNAYARVGRYEEARTTLRAAIAGERYQLELADGSWMDSRAAARLALAGLKQTRALALK